MSFNVTERIRSLLDRKSGKTQAALARYCGVSTSAVSQWLSGGGIDEENILKSARFFGVSYDWLKTGIGDRGDGSVFAFVPGEETPPPGFVSIAEYRLRLGCGAHSGIPEWEEVHDTEDAWYRESFFRKKGVSPDRCRRAKVNGDSMEPSICSGDRVLWVMETDTQVGCVSIVDGAVYVIAVNGEMRVKRLANTKDGIIIKSDNQEYPAEKYINEECDRVRIYGRVIEVTRSI